MRVDLVSEHASPLAALGGEDAGGQNVHVAALAEGLAHAGVDVTVHTRRDDRALPRYVEAPAGFTVHHVDAGPPEALPKDELLPHMGAFARELVREWGADPPDLVHAHFWMSGVASLMAGRAAGVPVAHTFHALGVVKRRHQGDADTSPAGRVAHEARIMRDADRIIATCSDEVFELLRQGADRRRVSIVPCGVDTAHFTPRGPAAARGERPRVLAVGRLVPRKGVDDAIRAMALVPDAELVVAGGPGAAAMDADPEVRRLRRVARAAGVGDRVRLLGAVSRDDMPALLRSADAVVCAPWYEPFGIVPLEAMACGVPVVAARVGGLVDSVVHEVTGLHVPPRDPRAIAAALRALLGDEARRIMMGAAGIHRARTKFDWSRVTAGTLEAYARTLAPAGAERRSMGVAAP
ncbi:MAG: glycosyltransferase [Thermoleophilia bacterium]